MSVMPEAGSNAAYCADLVRSHDFDRYAATLFVTPAQRRALLALYAFNLEIVRVRDQVTQPLPGEIRLQWWSDTLAGTAHGGVEGNPVAAEMLWAMQAYGLPVAALAALIEQHQFDLYNDPMPDMALLEGYLAATFSRLFVLAAQILGDRSEAAADLARHAGLAAGLLQVIANLPHDSARRQLFLPQDLLERHGVALEQVFAGTATPALRAALAELVRAARAQLDTALTLLPKLPVATRAAFLPLALVRRDLNASALAGADPFAVPQRSRLATLWTLWRASKSRMLRG